MLVVREQGTRGRETESKAIVAIAVEKNGRRLGRIRLQQIGDVSTASLLPFVQGAVERGAMVHTDGWRGYAGLAAAGYPHQVTVPAAAPTRRTKSCRASTSSPRCSSDGSIGTHQGGVQHQHLDYYLDEFTFRLQSPQIKGPQAALPSPRPTSTRRWTRALQRDRQAMRIPAAPRQRAMKGIPIWMR